LSNFAEAVTDKYHALLTAADTADMLALLLALLPAAVFLDDATTPCCD
jgi:hypothetical protein